MLAKASLLITGNEVRDALIQESNSKYLVAKLRSLGIEIVQWRTTGDTPEMLLNDLKELAAISSIIIITGGMGPTQDDHTRDILSQFSGKPLVQDRVVLAKLKERFQRMGRAFDSSNNKQADFPLDSEQIENPTGTANGIYLVTNQVRIIALPGVPSEIASMWDSVSQMLQEDFPNLKQPNSYVFSIFGLAESQVAGILRGCSVPDEVEVAFRFQFPCIFLTITSLDLSSLNETKILLEQAIEADYIYSLSHESIQLEESLSQVLQDMPYTVCGAESCTGGLIAKLLTDKPGASSYFLGTAITYANSAKIDILNVSEETLQKHGAVSPECAAELAISVKKLYGADIAYSVTGIAGPEGGTDNKPVGLFFVGLAMSGSVQVYRYEYPGTRDKIRTFAAYSTMDLIRRYLGGLKVKKSVHQLDIDIA